ncbi:MAG: class I SAM-dependent methyltransferase [Candidatus Cloacimonetes bacterium]|nr:class I SAM-dependent methyltransferase [Candidatus Cloacimonadota bacterium]
MFRTEILKYLSADSEVLDLGAGAGIVEQMNFKGLVRKICGVDLDPRVEENPYLDEGRKASANQIPYPDRSFDLVFSDNVLEHLEHPELVFQEVFRVLKPGGVFLAKTPNKYHYMPLIARLTPHWFHQWVNKLRGRASVDTFPTLYRANCRRDFMSLSGKAGFEVKAVLLHEGRPEYLRIFTPAYLIGYLYQRIVQSFDFLSQFRVVMVGIVCKPI